MKRSSLADRYCSIARASAELVDGWTFVILRELFLGNRRFDGLQAQTGMSPRSLTLRLKSLLDDGILHQIPVPGNARRKEYRMTEKGLDLWPMIIMLKQWGDKWQGPWDDDSSPLSVVHRGTDHELDVGVICKECGEPVDAHSGVSHVSLPMSAERVEMARTHAQNITKTKK